MKKLINNALDIAAENGLSGALELIAAYDAIAGEFSEQKIHFELTPTYLDIPEADLEKMARTLETTKETPVTKAFIQKYSC